MTQYLLACALLLVSGDDELSKKEHARFEGVWSFERVEVEGKTQPPAPFETNKIIISKDGSFIVVQGPRITRGSFKLDPTKMPKHFDTTVNVGSERRQTSFSIYELGDDTYKLCSSFRSKERPAAFETKPESGLILHVMKREKQEVKEALVQVGRQELAGTWQAVSYALDGNKASAEEMKKIKLAIDADGKFAAQQGGKTFLAGTTKIDPSSKTRSIDITYTEGNLNGQTSLGIYKIEENVLSICRASPGKPRPTSFASEPGSGQTLMTYKRDKARAE